MSKADQVWSQMPMLRLRAMMMGQSKSTGARGAMTEHIFPPGGRGRRHNHLFLRNHISIITEITAMEPITMK
jgi:hypothetical protein